jgi:hypothetical protein
MEKFGCILDISERRVSFYLPSVAKMPFSVITSPYYVSSRIPRQFTYSICNLEVGEDCRNQFRKQTLFVQQGNAIIGSEGLSFLNVGEKHCKCTFLPRRFVILQPVVGASVFHHVQIKKQNVWFIIGEYLHNSCERRSFPTILMRESISRSIR